MKLLQWAIDMKLMIQWAITSSALILIVLAVGRLFREKLSARLRYALWGVVLLRLLIPFQVELPAAAPVPVLASNLAQDVTPWLDDTMLYAIPSKDQPGGSVPAGMPPEYIRNGSPEDGWESYTGGLVYDGNRITRYTFMLSALEVLVFIWIAGAALMMLVLAASNLRFYGGLRKRRRPLEVSDSPVPVYTAEGLPSPCLFGVLRPAVYVTPQAAEDPTALRHVLAHELTHCAHRDHIWSLLRVLALALHWYNPLVWLAAVLSKRDGELACDEGAVARLGEAERVPYGRTLVDMVAARSLGPAGLLSCSTAMTGGKKSIQQRVAQLVKKPETVKTALFAAVALVALAAVFVFAGRGEAGSTEVDVFLAQLEGAQAVFVGQPMFSSAMPPGLISDPEPLSQVKELLSKTGPVVRGEGDWTVMSLSSDHPSQPITQEELEELFFLRGHPLNLYPTADRDLETAHRYWLLQGEDCCLLARWYPEREENSVEALAALPVATISRLKMLAGQYVPSGAIFPEPDSFPADVANAQAIRLRPNSGEDYRYPDITDEDLLEQARDRLSLLEPPTDNPPAPALDALEESWQLTLISGGEERAYTLLARSDYTYLVRGDAPEEYRFLAEGQTMDLGPFWRTQTRINILPSLNSMAAQQFARMDEDQAASYFGGNSYHNFLAHASAIYRLDRETGGERAITDLNLLLHARELLALERLPRDEAVEWDGQGWTETLTISVRGPTQERSEESEQLYYVVPKDGESSYLCSMAERGGSYLGTVSNENLEELERLFQDQEKLDSILLGALEDCGTIRFEDSSDPDITDPAALERAREILTSGLLIDDLNQTGAAGDNEHITIRSASGLKESSFLVTNRSIREELHSLARRQVQAQEPGSTFHSAVENCRLMRVTFDRSLPMITDPDLLEEAREILLNSGSPELGPGKYGNVEFLVNDGGLGWHIFQVNNQTILQGLRGLAERQREILRGGLTQAQVDRANQAFRSNVETAPGEYGFSEISCFFTSSYADPTQIDLEEFLRYCPLAEEVTRVEAPEEYQTVLSLGWAEKMTDPDFLMPVPMWRYPREKVSALLQKYAGVTVEDQLDWGDMIYLEEYDAFYNFTSDAGPGFFTCAGGQIDGDTVLLWSEPTIEGDRSELTLRRQGGEWLIQSFHTAYPR